MVPAGTSTLTLDQRNFAAGDGIECIEVTGEYAKWPSRSISSMPEPDNTQVGAPNRRLPGVTRVQFAYTFCWECEADGSIAMSYPETVDGPAGTLVGVRIRKWITFTASAWDQFRVVRRDERVEDVKCKCGLGNRYLQTIYFEWHRGWRFVFSAPIIPIVVGAPSGNTLVHKDSIDVDIKCCPDSK